MQIVARVRGGRQGAQSPRPYYVYLSSGDPFEIGVRYQMYHALALIAAAWACTKWPGAWANASGWFGGGDAGVVGSLYRSQR